jgi:hypothetical protein
LDDDQPKAAVKDFRAIARFTFALRYPRLKRQINKPFEIMTG